MVLIDNDANNWLIMKATCPKCKAGPDEECTKSAGVNSYTGMRNHRARVNKVVRFLNLGKI